MKMEGENIQWSAGTPEIDRLCLEVTLLHNCYICILPNNIEPVIKQSQVADLLEKNFVARIRVAKIQIKGFSKPK